MTQHIILYNVVTNFYAHHQFKNLFIPKEIYCWMWLAFVKRGVILLLGKFTLNSCHCLYYHVVNSLFSWYLCTISFTGLVQECLMDRFHCNPRHISTYVNLFIEIKQRIKKVCTCLINTFFLLLN